MARARNAGPHSLRGKDPVVSHESAHPQEHKVEDSERTSNPLEQLINSWTAVDAGLFVSPKARNSAISRGSSGASYPTDSTMEAEEGEDNMPSSPWTPLSSVESLSSLWANLSLNDDGDEGSFSNSPKFFIPELHSEIDLDACFHAVNGGGDPRPVLRARSADDRHFQRAGSSGAVSRASTARRSLSRKSSAEGGDFPVYGGSLLDSSLLSSNTEEEPGSETAHSGKLARHPNEDLPSDPNILKLSNALHRVRAKLAAMEAKYDQRQAKMRYQLAVCGSDEGGFSDRQKGIAMLKSNKQYEDEMEKARFEEKRLSNCLALALEGHLKPQPHGSRRTNDVMKQVVQSKQLQDLQTTHQLWTNWVKSNSDKHEAISNRALTLRRASSAEQQKQPTVKTLEAKVERDVPYDPFDGAKQHHTQAAGERSKVEVGTDFIAPSLSR